MKPHFQVDNMFVTTPSVPNCRPFQFSPKPNFSIFFSFKKKVLYLLTKLIENLVKAREL